MRSVRREIGRYPIRFVVMLGCVYGVFIIVHGKSGIPDEGARNLHELVTHEEGLGTHDKKAPLPLRESQTHEKTENKKKPTAMATGGKRKETLMVLGKPVDISSYGNGIFHVQVDTEHCKYQDTVLDEGLTPVPISHDIENNYVKDTQSGFKLKFHTEGDTIRFESGNIAVSVDISSSETDVHLKNVESMTGLPERTSGLILENGDYELWNLDVFQYKLNDKAPLYGIVPIVVGVSSTDASGFLWLNPAKTSVKVHDNTKTTWKSARNCQQFVIYPGPSTADVLRQHSVVTGKPFMPPEFSIGYHQCRWNYHDEHDVDFVSKKFIDNKMPCDAIWLDIEHTEKKHYFTWDKRLFPTPLKMQDSLKEDGRKLITISDPHISRSKGYFVYDEAHAKELFVKDKNGNSEYHGHCWPGDSSWVDFLNPAAREWYAGLFYFDKYKGSTEDLHTWIDMNEPSVFSGPRTTMHDDARHYDGSEHIAVHNIYGHLHARATHEGLLARTNGEKRGFVLSRSFFAGTQRYAAIWTGDNQASWAHLKASVEMLLGLGMGGIPFVGADVGGFFENSTPDLMARWFQLGVFYPFYRGHSHHDNKRKEPYLNPPEQLSVIADALHLRYTLLPYLYTMFWNASTEGIPVLRPLFLEFPEERAKRSDAFMFGDAILAAPIVSKSAHVQPVTMPGDGAWYEYFSGRKYNGGDTHEVQVELSSLPMYQRGGTIVVTKEKDAATRSTVDLKKVGYRLRVALDPDTQTATGRVYLDDGHTFKYKQGYYNFKLLSFSSRNLTVTCAHSLPTTPFTAMPPADVPYTPPTANVTSIFVLGLNGEVAKEHESEKISGGVLIKNLNLPIYGGWGFVV
eukprot:TRINITY_DN11026_c0_g1_i1.p1 TRINITY_DN11026_c0_g1~~TRINITY_DN11026_c0_g1_i1.p1  ORF type:complete len:852 (+),score=114.53 TRINITY_DN11026_c0_g1_i1:222-2777(+)